MDKAQVRVAVEKIVEQFSEQMWKVRVHKNISHPLYGKGGNIYLELVVRSVTFSIVDPLPDEFFVTLDRDFTLPPLSTDSIKAWGNTGDQLLKIVDSMLSEMRATLVLGEVDEIAHSLMEQVDDIENIGDFSPLCKLRFDKFDKHDFSIRDDGSACSIRNFLPVTSVQAIKAVAGMAGKRHSESV